jgi:hypothetical protein
MNGKQKGHTLLEILDTFNPAIDLYTSMLSYCFLVTIVPEVAPSAESLIVEPGDLDLY